MFREFLLERSLRGAVRRAYNALVNWKMEVLKIKDCVVKLNAEAATILEDLPQHINEQVEYARQSNRWIRPVVLNILVMRLEGHINCRDSYGVADCVRGYSAESLTSDTAKQVFEYLTVMGLSPEIRQHLHAQDRSPLWVGIVIEIKI